MQLFRSKSMLTAYLERRGIPFGYVLTARQTSELGAKWYGGRLEPSWRDRSLEDKQRVFTSVGLEGEFWSLRAWGPGD